MTTLLILAQIFNNLLESLLSQKHDLTSVRRDYSAGSLTRANLPADPLTLFSQWFAEAQVGESLDPTAVTLATYNEKIGPSARIVLLKHYDQTGFCWFTDYGSNKAEQLSQTARAELLFYWPKLERQIRISGHVSKTSREQSVKYFNVRPEGSRLSAAASLQSRVVESRAALEQQVATLRQQYPNGDVPCPESWGGYCLSPERYEFWQGRDNRLHDRFQFSKQGGQWLIDRLSP